MTTLYGIKNCDTVKKARRWLDTNNVDYSFHDFREDGIDREQVVAWLSEIGWEKLVNRRSTSWKALSPSQRSEMSDETAVNIILEMPTLIKRPLLDTGNPQQHGQLAGGFFPHPHSRSYRRTVYRVQQRKSKCRRQVCIPVFWTNV
jgi:Spx/MgsR family transcriptional regulator